MEEVWANILQQEVLRLPLKTPSRERSAILQFNLDEGQAESVRAPECLGYIYRGRHHIFWNTSTIRCKLRNCVSGLWILKHKSLQVHTAEQHFTHLISRKLISLSLL